MSTDSIEPKEKSMSLLKQFFYLFFKSCIALGIIGIVTFLFLLLIKAKTLPVFLAFLLPIIFGLIGSLLYFWKKTKYLIIWSTDLSLAVSAMIVATASIAKSYDQKWYDSLGLGQSEYSAAVFSYISFCALIKVMITIYSFSEYEKKYK